MASSYRTAVLCYQRGMRYPMAYPEPLMRVMSKNSLDGFIRPFEVHLRSRSVRIYRDTKVERVMLKERGGEVCTSRPLAMGDGDMGKTVLPYDALVLAVPIKQLSILLDDALFATTSRFRRAGLGAPPRLGNFRDLQSAAMASLDIQFRHKIPGMPKEHITVVQSEFDLSCVDLSQLWKTGDATYINAVATNGRALHGLSEDYRQHLLLEEGLAFLGQRPADVESVTYRSNDDAPLFLNETGSWHDRPEAYTAVPSIVVAGDLVRNSFGIASVEGAMLSAKQAVLYLARDLGLQTQPRILVPQHVSNDSIRLRKQALEPWQALALSTLWAQRRASRFRFDGVRVAQFGGAGARGAGISRVACCNTCSRCAVSTITSVLRLSLRIVGAAGPGWPCHKARLVRVSA